MNDSENIVTDIEVNTDRIVWNQVPYRSTYLLKGHDVILKFSDP